MAAANTGARYSVNLVTALVTTETDFAVQRGATAVKTAGRVGEGGRPGPIDATSIPVKRKGPLTSAVNGPMQVGATGLEPVTPSVSSWCSSQLS